MCLCTDAVHMNFGNVVFEATSEFGRNLKYKFVVV